MNRKYLKTVLKTVLALAAMGLLALAPLAAQPGYSDETKDDGEVEVRMRAEADTGEEGGEHKYVRIVLTADDGEPETYEWKSESGDVVSLSGEGNVHFLSDLTRRGYLGVQLVELTPELRQHYGVSPEIGVLVGKVEPGSPAEAAGLRVGDLITALDGEGMGSSWEIRRHIRALEEGESVAIEVHRDGSRLDLSGRIVEKERPEVDIGRFFGRAGGSPWVYSVDPGEMQDVLVDLKERFTSPEFQTRIQAFSSREEELEKRLEELEKKLEELQKKLEER